MLKNQLGSKAKAWFQTATLLAEGHEDENAGLMGPFAAWAERMAHGGIVTRPTLAMLGEQGPEAVIPLNHGAGGNTINVTIYSTGPIEEQKLLRWIAEGIRPLWARAAI